MRKLVAYLEEEPVEIWGVTSMIGENIYPNISKKLYASYNLLKYGYTNR